MHASSFIHTRQRRCGDLDDGLGQNTKRLEPSKEGSLLSLEYDRFEVSESDDEEEIKIRDVSIQKLIEKCSKHGDHDAQKKEYIRYFSGAEIAREFKGFAAICNGATKDSPTAKIIGQGGFATVYHVTDYHAMSEVAIKRLSPQRQSNERDYRRFIYEILALESVRDVEQCARMLGFCIERPYCCIIMEHMSRGSLYDILHDKNVRLPWSHRMQIAMEMALAMRELHDRDLVHRDFKVCLQCYENQMISTKKWCF